MRFRNDTRLGEAGKAGNPGGGVLTKTVNEASPAQSQARVCILNVFITLQQFDIETDFKV